MSVPIIESIAANLLTTVNTVTVANGYNQTVVAKRASRVDYETETADDLTGRIYQTTAEKLTSTMNRDTWRQSFEIQVLALNADGSAITIDTRLNQIAADISKAVRIDVTRGSNAFHTGIDSVDFFVADDGSVSGVVLTITVDYRVLTDNQYTKG